MRKVPGKQHFSRFVCNKTIAHLLTYLDNALSNGTGFLATPPNFKLGDPPVYFDVRTTAGYVPGPGAVAVSFSFAGISFTDVTNIQLFHYETGKDGKLGWVAAHEAIDVDWTEKRISAKFDSL